MNFGINGKYLNYLCACLEEEKTEEELGEVIHIFQFQEVGLDWLTRDSIEEEMFERTHLFVFQWEQLLLAGFAVKNELRKKRIKIEAVVFVEG
jgi:hypothetical protein